MTTTTTTAKNKVSDRYAALAAHANLLPGFSFATAKRPTAKDCDELSEAIAKHEAGLAEVIEMATAAPVVEAAPVAPRAALVEALATLDAVDGGTSAAVLTAPAKDRARIEQEKKEAEREEAHAKFYDATKATSAHAYALMSAGTKDGNRLENMRARLETFPEAIRQGACKLAMSKVGSSSVDFRDDLKKLHDESPAPAGKEKKQRAEKEKGPRLGGATPLAKGIVAETFVRAVNGAGGKLVLKSESLLPLVGAAFEVEHRYEGGKLVVMLKQK
jgi:hypothetical protein